MINHLVKTLDYYGKEGEIEDHVQFYDLKVTENDDDDGQRNDFDLNKKEEAIPDSDDEDEEQDNQLQNSEITQSTAASKPVKAGAKRAKNEDK